MAGTASLLTHRLRRKLVKADLCPQAGMATDNVPWAATVLDFDQASGVGQGRSIPGAWYAVSR